MAHNQNFASSYMHNADKNIHQGSIVFPVENVHLNLAMQIQSLEIDFERNANMGVKTFTLLLVNSRVQKNFKPPSQFEVNHTHVTDAGKS